MVQLDSICTLPKVILPKRKYISEYLTKLFFLHYKLNLYVYTSTFCTINKIGTYFFKFTPTNLYRVYKRTQK